MWVTIPIVTPRVKIGIVAHALTAPFASLRLFRLLHPHQEKERSAQRGTASVFAFIPLCVLV
jgi:hypothetical protein